MSRNSKFSSPYLHYGRAQPLAPPLLILILLLMVGFVPGTCGDCVFKGLCGGDDPSSPNIPCIAEGSAKKPHELDNDSLMRLASLCSDFREPSEKSFCCDQAQVNWLLKELNRTFEELVGKCPSCKYNLARVFCHIHCSPEQHKFIEVTNSVWTVAELRHRSRLVGNVSIYLDNDYIQRTYDSCAGVMSADGATFAIQLLCGEFGMRCSPEKLIAAIGTSIMAPTMIEFLYEAPVGYELFDHGTTGCHEAPFDGEFSCHCKHCTDACIYDKP